MELKKFNEIADKIIQDFAAQLKTKELEGVKLMGAIEGIALLRAELIREESKDESHVNPAGQSGQSSTLPTEEK